MGKEGRTQRLKRAPRGYAAKPLYSGSPPQRARRAGGGQADEGGAALAAFQAALQAPSPRVGAVGAVLTAEAGSGTGDESFLLSLA